MNYIMLKFEKEFTVRSYEVDHTKCATLPSVCNYFQEAAGLHANELNFDIEDLHKKGLTWVLYKMHLKVERYPRRWETIKIETWPSIGDGFRAFRDYKMTDKDGKTVALGVSQWIVLDVLKRKAVRLPNEVRSFGHQAESHVLNEQESLHAPQSNSDLFITTVGAFNMDMNNHPNNVAYIEWLTGYMNTELLDGKMCYDFRIQFMAEAKSLDQIFLTYDISEESDIITITHSIKKEKGGKELAIALSKWK